ncbi:MAG: lipase family protein, partial [Taibaiella sp.]|nr:lipase family protein [Taibaiella sp.]
MKKHLEKTSHQNKPSLFARIARVGALTLTVAGIMGAGGCRNNTAPEDDMPPSYTSSYAPVQKLFCLNILSNVSSHYNGHAGDTILDSTIYAIDTVLNDSGVQQLIGKWKCVWGPGVLINTKSANRSTIAANTMYIVQSLDTPGVYVAAIAGTDFESISDWLGEDADVTFIRYWDSVLTNLDTNTSVANIQFGKPFISRATNNGLFQIMNLIDSTQPANKQRASDFLQQLIANAASPITIWTTGHSLGGALSPTLALYLEDKWANANKNVAIGCLAVAGATPGNKLFASRFNSELGNNFIRVWNQQDVVPHGYASAWLQTPPPPYLRQVDTLYN